MEEHLTTAQTAGPEWSALAEPWVRWWAHLADPARRVVLDVTGVGPGTRLADLGCGSGEFLDMAAARGAEVAGTDAADALLAIARRRLPGADLRLGPIERLPWPDDAFDVVTAFNSVQYAADQAATVAEAARITRPGGLLAICAWGADAVCDVEAVSIALERLAAGGPVERGTRLGEPGIIDGLVTAEGMEVVSAQDVAVPYELDGDEALQEAFALDAELAGARRWADEEAVRATIAHAAAPFRRPGGGYRFDNVFRVVVASNGPRSTSSSTGSCARPLREGARPATSRRR